MDTEVSLVLPRQMQHQVEHTGDGGVGMCVGAGSILEISVPSVLFCCTSKTSLKIENLNLKNPENKSYMCIYMCVCVHSLKAFS